MSIINAKLFKREDMLVGVEKGLTQIMFVRIKIEILVMNIDIEVCVSCTDTKTVET